jgi:hypothetical protein
VDGGVKHCQRCHPKAVAVREALAAPTTPTPGPQPWCGQCDRATRFEVTPGLAVRRPCPRCHAGPTRASAPSVASREEHRETARRIVQAAARRLALLSANDVRAEMVAAGVPASVRSRVFQSAEDAGLLERVGHVPSTAPATKGHELRQYRSLVLLCRACGRELGTALARAGAAVHVDCSRGA